MPSINLYFGQSQQNNYEYLTKLAEREYDGNLSRAINVIISKHRNDNNTIEQRLDEILFAVRNLRVVEVGEVESTETVSGIGGEFFK